MAEDTKFPLQDKHGRPRIPYAVNCYEGPIEGYPGCGLVYLTKEEYNRQINAPYKTWRCPLCRYEARWDDDNYEEFLQSLEEDGGEYVG